MKHIKKKFLEQYKASQEEFENLRNTSIEFDITQASKVQPPKEYDILLFTDQSVIIKGFHIKIDGNNYIIPEPDPILIMYNHAYLFYIEIDKTKKQLLEAFNFTNESTSNNIIYSQINVLYSYFGICNGFIINLFASLEAFINHTIPEYYVYHDVKKDKTSVYNKEQIERHLSFDTKYSAIIKQIKNIDYKNKYPLKHQHIMNLKEMRDNIIHLKAKKGGDTKYDYIFKKVINFNYKEALLAIKHYFNTLRDNYIEDCPCNENY